MKGARAVRGADRDRLYSLFEWRDGRARSMDVPPFKVLGNKALMAMAGDPPADLDALAAVDGVGPRAVRRWGRDLMKILRQPETAPRRIKTPRTPGPNAAVRKRIKDLTAVRDEHAKALGLQPGLVCRRGCLNDLAETCSVGSTRDDLVAGGLNGWRLDVLGDEFLAVLNDG
jgi:ribonuclease D